VARAYRQPVALLAAWLAAMLSAAPAVATDWTVTLGVDGRVMPTYPGAGSDRLIPIPLFDLRQAGTPRHFSSPRDGLSIGILDSGGFRAGITGKAQLPRRESDSPDLAGLGNVDWAIEPGLFVEYWPVNWLRTRAEIRQGIGGHHGQVGDLSADLVMPVSPSLTLSGGPRLALATSNALQPYFGITPVQAAASIYPAYNAAGGMHSVGFGGMARYEWSPQWATHFYAEYERLTGSSANSPIVTMRGSPNQMQVGIGATYSFNVNLF